MTQKSITQNTKLLNLHCTGHYKRKIMKYIKYIFLLLFTCSAICLLGQPFSTGGIQCTSHGKPDCEQHAGPCPANSLQLTAITYPGNWLPGTSFTIEIKDVVPDTLLTATVNGIAVTTFCIPEDQCLELTIFNDQGMPQLPPGAYTLMVNGDTLVAANEPGLTAVYNLGSCCSSLLGIMSAVQPISCNGNQDGSIVLDVQGGVGPYAVNWSDGTANTDALYNLPSGMYSATVTDALGCMSTVGPFSLVEPALLAASITSQLPSAVGASDGSITVNPMGGTPAYSYQWSTGDQTNTVANVDYGTYSVLITDQNGCTVEETIDLAPLTVSLKVLLEGNLDSSFLMKDRLRQMNLIPLGQPYAVAPFNYNGTEMTTSAVLSMPGNEAVADWVLVQLRSSVATVVATQAGLLL